MVGASSGVVLVGASSGVVVVVVVFGMLFGEVGASEEDWEGGREGGAGASCNNEDAHASPTWASVTSSRHDPSSGVCAT
eukprot:2790466-Pleurochrysis_carterae.AAC.1